MVSSGETFERVLPEHFSVVPESHAAVVLESEAAMMPDRRGIRLRNDQRREDQRQQGETKKDFFHRRIYKLTRLHRSLFQTAQFESGYNFSAPLATGKAVQNQSVPGFVLERERRFLP